jgi:hypothetical protein
MQVTEFLVVLRAHPPRHLASMKNSSRIQPGTRAICFWRRQFIHHKNMTKSHGKPSDGYERTDLEPFSSTWATLCDERFFPS